MQLTIPSNFSKAINDFAKSNKISENINAVLKNSFKESSASDILSKVTDYNLTNIQKKKLIKNYALDAEDYKTVASITALSKDLGKSQATAAVATTGLGSAFKGLGTVIKTTITANPILAVVAAVAALGAILVYASKAGERAKETALESQEALKEINAEIADLQSELQTLQDRINELNSQKHLTLLEAEELNNLKKLNTELEREMRLRSQIAADAGDEANSDALKYFNRKNSYGITPGNVDFTGDQIEIVDFKLNKIAEMENYIKEADENNSPKDFTYYKYESLIPKLRKQVAESISEFTDLDDSLIKGMDEGILERLENLYIAYDETVKGISVSQQNILSGILNKVNFQTDKEALLALGEQGSLSINELSKNFPELINYLQAAGISADELYQYIMQLSNPTGFDIEGTSSQLLEAVGASPNGIGTFDSDKYKQLKDAGMFEAESLEAFLVVKAKYMDEETAYWNMDDWISHINDELPDLDVPISLSENVTQFSTNLKPTLESLKSVYQSVISSDELAGDKFNYENVTFDMLEGVKSALDSLNGMEGIDIDYSSYDDFVRILTDSNSQADEVKNAFDNLSYSLLNNSSIIGELDDDSKDLLITLLKQVDVADAEAVVLRMLNTETETLALQEQFASENQEDLAHATNAVAKEFLNEARASESARMQLFQLAAAEQVFSNQTLSTADKIAALKELAAAYGDVAMQEKLADVENLVSTNPHYSDADLYNDINTPQTENSSPHISYNSAKSTNTNTNDYASAGSSAGSAYVDAFEEELSKLKELRDNGFITEKSYLDRLRVLYENHYGNRADCAEQYSKYEREYLSGMKSMYESLFSYISGLYSKKISATQEEKDAAIESLEEQKAAAEAAYQSQIDAIDEQISAIDKKKDAIQDEINAIKEASSERQRELDLQKAKYDLERLENQRTVKTLVNGEFVYTTDQSAIRDARENLAKTEEEVKISNLEKQINALDKNIDALETQKEAIQSMMDSSNSYWDSQIAQTEKYYDTLINGMEEQQSRWDELSGLQEHAEMIALLQELGYTEEQVLNMSSGAFEDFRLRYLSVLADMNAGNQGVLDSLSQITDMDFAEVPSHLKETAEAMSELSSLSADGLGEGLSTLDSSLQSIATSATEANAAITGGAAPSGTDNAGASGGNPSSSSGGSGGLNNTLSSLETEGVPHVNALAAAFAGENTEGSQSVASAVGAAAAAIGMPTVEGEDPDPQDASLAATMQLQSKAALDTEKGIPAQTKKWEELNIPLNDASNHLTDFKNTLEELDGSTFTIELNINSSENPTEPFLIPFNSSRASGTAHIEGNANVNGTAMLNGNWSLPKDMPSTLVGELGPEIVVRNGRFFTVGDTSPEFFDLKHGDIVFNHRQTEQLLRTGRTTGRGKTFGRSFSDGTVSDLPYDSPLLSAEKAALYQKLSGLSNVIDLSSAAIGKMQNHFDKVTNQLESIHTVNHFSNNQPQITIGDIHLHEVQSAGALAQEINNRFPNAMLQAAYMRA